MTPRYANLGLDLLLDADGDLVVSPTGDLAVTPDGRTTLLQDVRDLGTRYWQLAGSATCGSLHTVAKTAADGFATIASWSCNDASLIRIECVY